MKRIGKKIYLVYLIFILMYAGITGLILSLLGGESARSRLLMEYRIEKTAALFMESFMRDLFSESGEMTLPDNVLGFGIYQSGGEKIRTWGTAPDSIDTNDIPERGYTFSINKTKKSLALIRRVGFRHMQPGLPPFMNHMRQRHDRQSPTLLYFEIDASDYLHRTQRRIFLSIFISLFLLVLMAGLLALYRKNREYREKLTSKNQLARLGEMARVLAHEIKNPLGAMRIQTGYLKKVLPAEHTKDLYLIEEEIDRLSLLTNRISDFVRDPLGTPENISLIPFIQNLLKRFNTPISFTHSLTDDSIFFDRERLRSVLENVINNAIESRQGENKETTPVEMEVSKIKRYIILSVCDRGPGIGSDKMEKVFDPFFTTRAKGSGIGLSITKRFIEAAGGKIDLVPRDGGGTEVRIYFSQQS